MWINSEVNQLKLHETHSQTVGEYTLSNKLKKHRQIFVCRAPPESQPELRHASL